MTRTCITGGPRTGKTTLANSLRIVAGTWQGLHEAPEWEPFRLPKPDPIEADHSKPVDQQLREAVEAIDGDS